MTSSTYLLSFSTALATFQLSSLASWNKKWVKLQACLAVCSQWWKRERQARRTWNLFQEWGLKSIGHDCKWYACFTDVLLKSVQLSGDVGSQMLVSLLPSVNFSDLKCLWHTCRLHLLHGDKCSDSWVIKL